MVKEREYAFLNELKWFLIFKFSESLDWEGSADETRTLAMLSIFATLLQFYFAENSPELIVLEREAFSTIDPAAKWDYVTSEIRALFDLDCVPEMDQLLEAVWASMVIAAKQGKAGN